LHHMEGLRVERLRKILNPKSQITMSLAVNKRKIVVAITGASGAIYALSLMKRLREMPEPPAEVAVILTGNAEEIMLYETGAVYVPSGT